VLRIYAHFMPEDHATSAMRAFFGALEGAETNPSARDVPGVAR
jgi:hypothetical protein